MIRAYAPIGAVQLDTLTTRGAFTPERVVAVTAQLEALAPDGDAELHEHLATQLAAALATADPVGVCAFDVDAERISERPASDVVGEVVLAGEVTRRAIACFLIADAGRRVSDDADLELSWYDAAEVGEVLQLFS